MHLNGTRDQPSALWRAWSSMTIVEIGALCRTFLFAANTTEVHGLESFMKLLDSRRDPITRKRGLITGIFTLFILLKLQLGHLILTPVVFYGTVSNHISVYVGTGYYSSLSLSR